MKIFKKSGRSSGGRSVSCTIEQRRGANSVGEAELSRLEARFGALCLADRQKIPGGVQLTINRFCKVLACVLQCGRYGLDYGKRFHKLLSW